MPRSETGPRYPCVGATLRRAVLACVVLGVLARARGAASNSGDDAEAPGEYVVRAWTTDEGLPHNMVSRIVQDRTGFVWLATMAGLARFDGREFRLIPIPDRPIGGGRNIRDLALLPDGAVLFLPASGGVYQYFNNTVSPYPVTRRLAGFDLRELYVDPGGAIWIGVADGIVRCFDGRIRRFGAADGIYRRSVRFSWATDRKGRTWIGGTDFLGYFDGRNMVKVRGSMGTSYSVASARDGGIWIFAQDLSKAENGVLERVADCPWPLGTASARCMYEDSRGILWIGTSSEGVYFRDSGGFHRVPDAGRSASNITEDREGDIWVSTESGIRRLRHRLFFWIDSPCTSVSEDPGTGLWFAAGPDGLIRRDQRGETRFRLPAARGPMHVSTVAADGRGRLWVGSSTGLSITSAGNPGATRRINGRMTEIRALWRSMSGDIWVAGPAMLGFYRGEKFTSLSDQLPRDTRVTAFAERPRGHFWFGTFRGHVYEWTEGRMRRAPKVPDFGGHPVHGILPEKSGELWLATTEGLVLVQGTRSRRFTREDGLPDDIVLQVLEDDAGFLWITTPSGLFRLDRETLFAIAAGRKLTVDAVSYGAEQGVQGVSPITNYEPSAYKDRHGDLWFCTYRGVLGIDPARIASESRPPRLLIDEVRLNGRAVSGKGPIVVPPGEDHVEIHFAALSFAAPERVRLRHELEGFDSGWVDTPPDRFARYSKLPPGSYRLRVIACNSEGVWSRKPVELGIRVLPAWWQTPWFRAASLLVFAGVVGWSARLWSQRKLMARVQQLEREHALEKERARIARDMHDDLGSRITGVNLAVQRLRTFRTPESSAILDQLDRRVRRLTLELDRVVWTVSPKNASLERLANFVERFAHDSFQDSNIHCRVTGATEMPPIQLSPECQYHILAIAREAMNNVLKHSQASEAIVALSHAAGVFTLSVRDNGTGFECDAPQQSRRNGLRNMSARAGEIGASLEIRSAPGAGSEVRLTVSLSVEHKA